MASTAAEPQLTLSVMQTMDRILHRILDWWHPIRFDPNAPPPTDEQLASREDPKHGIIAIDDSGFSVTTPKCSAKVKWEEATRIFCHKRDLLSTDLVCVGFSHSDHEPFVEVNEEMQGFVKLIREMKSRLPVAEKNFWHWFLHSPAFDGAATTIFEDTLHNETSDVVVANRAETSR